MNRRELKLSDVAKGANIPYSSLTDWKAGRSSPKVDKLCKIADFLGVSLDYLVRGKESQNSDLHYLSPYEYEIILAYRKADSGRQSAIDCLLGLEEKKKEAVLLA